MRYGIPQCSKPIDPKSIYMRNLYREWFWGPFKDEQEVIDAIDTLDKVDPYWDYDPFCLIYGADPLPKDFVKGFTFLDDAARERISNSRKVKEFKG